jgi:hypothetical protein
MKNTTKKMANFEKSGKDVEKKGMKEGSKADMALDKKQMMNKGGNVKKMATGGMLPDAAGRAQRIAAAFGQKAAPALAPALKAATAPAPKAAAAQSALKDNFVQKAQPAVKKAMEMIPKMKFNSGGMAKKKKK